MKQICKPKKALPRTSSEGIRRKSILVRHIAFLFSLARSFIFSIIRHRCSKEAFSIQGLRRPY
jgi:hypothetical protein